MSFINSFVILLSMGSEDSIRNSLNSLSITCKIHFSIYRDGEICISHATCINTSCT